MSMQIELAKHTLFDADRLSASNVKLFPGSSRDVGPEQMAEEVNKALAQIEAGDYDVVENLDD